jgi:WD40 repeat protein
MTEEFRARSAAEPDGAPVRNNSIARWIVIVVLAIAVLASACHPQSNTQDQRSTKAAPLDHPRLLAQLGVDFFWIYSVAISGDGRTVLTGSDDGTVKLWDTATGAELRTLDVYPQGKSLSSNGIPVAFSPEGHLALIGTPDGIVKLWDVETGVDVQTFKGHSGAVTGVVFSHDGRLALTGSEDGTAKLWDVATGRDLQTFKGHASQITSVALSSNARTALTGSRDGSAKLWDVATGAQLRTFRDENIVWSVAYAPDGHTILTGSKNSNATLWDLATGLPIRKFTHRFPVVSVAFSPDGHLALTGSWDYARLWDVATGHELKTLEGHLGGFSAVAFSRDGRALLTGSDHQDSSAKLWDVATGEVRQTFRGYSTPVRTVVFSPDGTTLHIGSNFTGEIWDLRIGAVVRKFREQWAGGDEASFSPDGRKVLIGEGDNGAELWDVVAGKLLHTFVSQPTCGLQCPPDTGKTIFVAFSPTDGGVALVGSGDRTILFNVATSRAVRSFPAFHGGVAFSPDGRRFASAEFAPVARIWDVRTGKELLSLRGHSEGITSVVFSPDGRTVLTGSFDGTAKLWDSATGVDLRTFSANGVESVAFSADGRSALTTSSDHTARLWDIATGDELRTLPGPGGVSSVAFSPDRSMVLVASEDGTSKLWDVKNGRELCTLVSFTDDTWAVVDPQGRFDASNGGDVQGLHWVLGNTPIELSQLKERYYDPGLLAKIMGFNKEPLRDVAHFDAPRLFPQVEASAPSGQDTKLRIHLTNQGGGIGKVRVLVNGKETAADARGPRPDANAATASLSVDLSGAALLPGQDNTVEVIAWNSEGYLSSRPTRVVYRPPGAATARKPELWAILSGISEYSDPDPKPLRLTFPTKDAESMAHALELGGERLFGKEHVHITLLSSSGQPGELAPTKANIQSAFQTAQKAQPDDVLVVYLAGHGVALQDLYAYPTQEARTLDLSDTAVRGRTSVTSEELVEWIKKIPTLHQVMILDTCAAGAAATKLVEKRDIPGDQVRALDRLKDRTGFHVLMGSAADAVSYEASRYGQGLLTYALLKGMKGPALKNDVDVDVSELFNYAANDVEQLAKGVGGIQRPQLISPTAGESFDIGELTPEDRGELPLAEAKPIYLRPALVNAAGPTDPELIAAVRRELRDRTLVSSRGAQPTADVIYVDADEMAGAISSSGTYIMDGVRITVQLWLTKGEVTRHITLHSSSADPATLAGKIVTAMFETGRTM